MTEQLANEILMKSIILGAVAEAIKAGKAQIQKIKQSLKAAKEAVEGTKTQ